MSTVLAHWMPLAGSYAHVAEVAGRAHHPQIVAWLADVAVGPDLLQDETPWCSAYVHGIMKESGIAGTGSAAARSWLRWGRPLMRPQFGCVTVLWRISRNSAHGHVAFYIGDAIGKYALWGGNQNNRVGLELYDPARVIGHFWPA